MAVDYAAGRVPQYILDYFRSKGWKIGFSYLDVWKEEHQTAFTVAKAMDLDILAAIREELDQALAAGQTFQSFQKNLMPHLQQLGWWGHKVMIDPQTGEEVIAEVGTPRRLKIIYDTNMRVARSVGQWQRIQRNKDVLPYLLYLHGPSREPRPEHLAWHGLLLPADDPFWQSHYPPSAWGCKCRVRQVTHREYERLKKEGVPAPGGNLPGGRLSGDKVKVQTTAPPTEYYTWNNPRTGETSQIPKGVDPGWDWNPGQSHLRTVQKLRIEKAKALAAKNKEAEMLALKLQAQMALKDLVAEEAQHELARHVAMAEAKAAAWKLQEAMAGNLGKWYQQAAKLGTSAKDLEQVAAELKAKYSQKVALANYKKAVLHGKKMQANWKAAYDALDDATKLAVKGELDAALAAAKAAEAVTAAAAEAATEQTILRASEQLAKQDIKDWVQIGPQRGSNPGGLFQAPDGTQWYVKFPKDDAIAHNEVLAGRLYQEAGIDVPDLILAEREGKLGVASKIIDGLAKDQQALTSGQVQGVWEGFATDAWLANWDVVGLGYDNLLVKAGKAYRVDTGGALLYRAQGTAKGAAFGDVVTELESLLNPSVNPQAAAVFGKLSEAEIKASVARVIAITDDRIKAQVLSYGYGSLAERQALADKLIARKADLIKRFPDLPQEVEKAQRLAEGAARNNLTSEIQSLDSNILEAIKGIASRAAKGAPLEAKDLARVAAAQDRYAKLLQSYGPLLDEASGTALRAHYDGWMTRLGNAVAPGEGAAAVWGGDVFNNWNGNISLTPGAVKAIFEPWMFGGRHVISDGQARQILLDAFGSSAADIDIPRHSGAEAFDSLPLHYQRALASWTGHYYQGITPAIWNGTASDKIKRYVDLVSASLNACPIKYRGQITRGLSLPSDGKFVKDHLDAWKNGTTLDSIIHASWKKGPRPAWGNVWLRCENSTLGVDVNPISFHHGPGEDETLTPRFSYRVVKAEPMGDDWLFVIEEV